VTSAALHQTEYLPELGNLSCSCGWGTCELDAVKADEAVMRHLRDEGVIV